MKKNQCIHQTDAPLFETFNTSEVWAAPDDTALYGERSLLVEGEMETPFIMSDLDIPSEQAEMNIAWYEAFGGEGNPETFNTLRERGYDGILERNGDRCFLYPERVTILEQDIHKGASLYEERRGDPHTC